jgi:hypothetical protein
MDNILMFEKMDEYPGLEKIKGPVFFSSSL